ncbi:unannotated protein [freshwater metagenome]|uniref:Unannotated protein n=2 Tax=freshwater metagenome TaxID=449393 RepID=A0A6J6ZDF5_9ZZZZ|nr:helix-turn-helix domain-containing protein [Actinomycetota bacterium]MSZ05494.1 helix-turn-helix domain-containing protein [Actinomycetota bacterium]
MTTPTMDSISHRLRAIRLSKNLSLRDVQIASSGRIPAVVLGSYERGDRSLSVKKAIAIAEFYEVPLAYLLSEPIINQHTLGGVVIDLRRLHSFGLDHLATNHSELAFRILTTFVAGIVQKRDDWNGEVLSLRTSDIESLALAMGSSCEALIQMLNTNKLLVTSDS